MALSELELRHIIQRGFLPLQCKCIIDSRGEFSVELLDQATGRNLVPGGIPRSQFDSCRGIANFVAEMKAQLAAQGGGEMISRRGNLSVKGCGASSSQALLTLILGVAALFLAARLIYGSSGWPHSWLIDTTNPSTRTPTQ
jgi:hypothetical protein